MVQVDQQMTLKNAEKSTLNTAHLRGQELTDSCFSNNKKHSHKLRERKLSILEVKNQSTK